MDAVLSHQDPPFRGCTAHQSRSDRLTFTALSWIKGSAPTTPGAWSPGGPSGGTAGGGLLLGSCISFPLLGRSEDPGLGQPRDPCPWL